MANYGDYDFPDELYYHKEHSWARVEEGKIRVGMNDMFRATAGDIVFVDLPSEGDEVAQGEVCGKIQSSKWIGKLYAPVGGEVVEINEDLSDDPALINKDPYGAGWLIVIEPSNREADLANLMQGEALRPWIEGEIRRAEELKKRPEGG